MATPATTHYVPTFGDPDDLKLVDLSFPDPLMDVEDVDEEALTLDVRVEMIGHILNEPRDEDERDRTRIQIERDWIFDQLDTIHAWTAFWRDEGEICIPDDLTDREIEDMNRDLGLVDVFPDPPYGYPLTATLE